MVIKNKGSIVPLDIRNTNRKRKVFVPTDHLKKRIFALRGFLKEKGFDIPYYTLGGASRKKVVGVYGELTALTKKHLTPQDMADKVTEKRKEIKG